ncbi:MAG: HDIG domain-containing protein [Bacteroidetes bacterium]|nr:MAG: HDIG domain-containing protein [Bacteroidota bacterium]
MKRWYRILPGRKLRSSRYLIRIGILAAFVLLMTLMMPRSFRLGYEYEVGKPWQGKTLEAPFDFAIYKLPDSVAREREWVGRQVKDIYLIDTLVPANTEARLIDRIDGLSRRLQAYRQARQEGDSARMRQLETNFFARNYPGLPLRQLEAMDIEGMDLLKSRSLELLAAIYDRGYLATSRPDTLDNFISLRVAPGKERYTPLPALLAGREQVERFVEQRGHNPDHIETILLKRWLELELRPNLIYSARLTREARQRQMSLVSPIYGKIEKGTLIISKDEIVDRRTAAVLASLVREQEQRYGSENRVLLFLSQLIVILLITGILLNYLRMSRPRIYFNNTKLALIFSTFLLTVGAMVVATKLTDVAVKLTDILGPNVNLSYIYLAPACIVPIFISNFFEFRTGFLCNLLLALFGAVLIQQGLEFAFVQIIAGTVAVYSMRRLRERERFFYTLGYIFLAYSLAYIAFNLVSKGSFSGISYHTLLLFAINVAITVIAYNLIYLFERVFGVTSDLTYLELLDTNHPLLQDLARKAPGTFQHSLQVANIAEATIKEIGGNPLLIHVGALYHDIGKTLNPRFFIENVGKDGGENPHETVSCEQSAEIIIGHVRHGVELANKYHLPQEIIQFIETHHGTTRVEYFYRQYLSENQCAEPTDEELFRYPGPMPFSKETAVLMIADSIEAASRSLKNPTPEKLRDLVDSIIDFKIQDNQLENSPLTFKDIATIRKVVNKQLISIYHGRIEYPKAPPVAPAVPNPPP